MSNIFIPVTSIYVLHAHQTRTELSLYIQRYPQKFDDDYTRWIVEKGVCFK